MEPISRTFPAAFRLTISPAVTGCGSGASTPPTASIAMRSAFFAVAS
ncbi:MAG: hypothetical protein ACRDNE_15805 [Gaiellaceae bacterium]